MSLGQDLAHIRKEKNLSLEDLFEATKIPVHTLKSIENDTLLKNSSEHTTYLRSYIRSYAKALKIQDAHILEALEATEKNTYNDTLLRLTNPDSISETYSVKKDKVEVNTLNTVDPENLQTDTYEEKTAETDHEEPIIKREAPSKKPTVDSVNWADMSKKVYASPAKSKAGLIIIFILLITGLAIAGYFYSDQIKEMFAISNNGAEEQTSSTHQSGSEFGPAAALVDTTQLQGPAATNSAIALEETLTVALYAAFDKLEPVRVTSDFNNRTNPFWMDQGEAYYFDFKDSLIVRGQYSRLLLFFNGHLINNPRQNYFDPALNSIVITRDVLNDPRYLATTAAEFPTGLGVPPPDSVIYRIQF